MTKGKEKRKQKRRASRGVTYADVCKFALQMPEVEQSTSYGTPALKVRKTLMARLKEDGETLVLRTTLADRERLLAAAPDCLYMTDHYVKYPWILVRLALVERTFLHELLNEAWRLSSPGKSPRKGTVKR